MIGRWIDGLSDVEKDRIIEGQHWTTRVLVNGRGERCLAGHVSNAQYIQPTLYFVNPVTGVNNLPVHGARGIGDTFDRLVMQHGMDRIVRACKMRAAKPQPRFGKLVQQPTLDRVAIGV